MITACGPSEDPRPREKVASIGERLGAAIDVNGVWHALGPDLVANGQANIDHFNSVRVPVTGRVTVVAPNPKAPIEDVWVGSATGGLWHGSVQPITGWQRENAAGSPAIGAIQLDSCAGPSIPPPPQGIACADVWVGTGEDAIRRDTHYGDGVYHGTLGPMGYSWTGPLGSSLFARGAISAMLLDPRTSGATKRVLVALSSGKTSNVSDSSVTTTPAGGYGVWMSNQAGIDGSWTQVISSAHPATALVLDPTNDGVAWAAVKNEGIFVTLDLASGIWVPANGGIPDSTRTTAEWPTLAAYHVGNVLRLYATLGTCPSPFANNNWCTPNVYMSTDGVNWTLQTCPSTDVTCPANLSVTAGNQDADYYDPLASYLSYTHAIVINPSNPENVCIGGINLFCSATSGTPPWGRSGTKQLHQDHHDLKIFWLV